MKRVKSVRKYFKRIPYHFLLGQKMAKTCLHVAVSAKAGRPAKIMSNLGFLPTSQPFSRANPMPLRADFGKTRPPGRRGLRTSPKILPLNSEYGLSRAAGIHSFLRRVALVKAILSRLHGNLYQEFSSLTSDRTLLIKEETECISYSIEIP